MRRAGEAGRTIMFLTAFLKTGTDITHATVCENCNTMRELRERFEQGRKGK